jgi:hypothetical protein
MNSTVVETACSPSTTKYSDSAYYSGSGTDEDALVEGEDITTSLNYNCTNGVWSGTFTTSEDDSLPKNGPGRMGGTSSGDYGDGACGGAEIGSFFYGINPPSSNCTSSCVIVCGEGTYKSPPSDKETVVSESCSSSPYKTSSSRTVAIKDAKTYAEYDVDKVCPTISNGSSSCVGSTTIAYSGEVSNAFDAEDARFDTQSWTQQGGLCAWKALATNGTMNESTADITINVSVDADPEKDYNVKVQMVVESNITQNNCSFRSHDSYVKTLTMKGGEVKSVTRSLSANNGQTKCLIHHSAVAYEA